MHRTAGCTAESATVMKCANCGLEGHGAADRRCRVFKERLQKLQEKDPEAKYRMFPTNDPATWGPTDDVRPNTFDTAWRNASAAGASHQTGAEENETANRTGHTNTRRGVGGGNASQQSNSSMAMRNAQAGPSLHNVRAVRPAATNRPPRGIVPVSQQTLDTLWNPTQVSQGTRSWGDEPIQERERAGEQVRNAQVGNEQAQRNGSAAAATTNSSEVDLDATPTPTRKSDVATDSDDLYADSQIQLTQ
jgi:hypothetical protein